MTGRVPSFSEYYASRGVVVVAINYKLGRADGSAPAFPEAVQDVYCAIRGIRARAATYHVDPDRIALRGGSAGATLVNMVALGGDDAPFNGGCKLGAGNSARVQAVVNYYGGADFEQFSLGGSDGLALFGPNPDAGLVLSSSPVNLVDAANPPYVIGHGTADLTVPIDQSRTLAAKLRSVGVEAQLVEVPGAPHGFIDNPFDGAYSRQVRCAEALFAKVLKPGS